MRNLLQYVGFRHLQMKPARTILTTLGVAFGVALYVAIAIINRSTINSFKENIDAVAGKSKLTVSLGEVGFPEEKIQIIKKIPGVKHAVPMIESRAYFVGSSETFYVFGVDLLQEQAVRTYKTTDEQVIDDPLVFLNQPDSIIISHSFAQEHGYKIDSQFSVATPNGIKKFTVRGMLSPEGPAKAYGGAIALMDIDGARMTFGKEGKVDRVDIVPADGQDVDQLAVKIREQLGPNYHVERPETQSADMERMVKSYQVMLTFFSTLALLVGLFLVTNSVSIAVAERRREIGTLRALGATRRGILLLFLGEATTMGMVGAFIGAMLGRLISSGMVGMISKSISAQYLTQVNVSHLEFTAHQVLNAVFLGGITAFFAALWPAYRATSIKPLEAMRQREIETDGAERDLAGLMPYAGFLLLGYLVISQVFQWQERFPILTEFNNFAAVVGGALVGPTLVGLLLRAFKPLLLKSGSVVLRLSTDNLLKNPKRTGSNVMSLMVGLILVMMIASVNVSFKQTIFDWFNRVLKSDITVSSKGSIITYEMQPLHEDIGQKLFEVPGVKKSPLGLASALRTTHIRYEDSKLALKAYDEPQPWLEYSVFDVQDRPSKEAGYELFHSATPSVFVSETFTAHHKKKTGDTLELETPTGVVSFKIIGTIIDYASAQGVLYMDRKLYKKYWNDPLVSVFGVFLEKGADAQVVRKEIDRRFGVSNNLMSTSNTELKEKMITTIDGTFAYTKAIEGAALLVALLGLLNTFLISVMERTRELGMLRAVGMSRRQMFWMILQESVIQGGLGAVVAVCLGSWTAYLWITHSLAHVLGWIIHFYFPWWSVVTTIITGTLVAFMAGVYPSHKASSIEIREALEYE